MFMISTKEGKVRWMDGQTKGERVGGRNRD